MTRIRTCALAIAAVFFIGGQASAQPQGGPNVTVVNTPLPVTVTNPSMAGTPVAVLLGNISGSGLPITFTVPTTQRLVIEYVSADCDTSGNTQQPVLGLLLTTSGVGHTFLLQGPFSPSAKWLYGQLVKVYADPGTNVLLEVGVGSCFLTFSGQLVTP